jgi:HD-like signal output (HDOD) protein/CheY-like chemotaxis protein
MSSERLKVLFVDDEVRLLQGLRRKLRFMREAWDMEFVDSAKEALSHIDRNNIDVVVADMRMPEMSGAVFFERVQEFHPEIIRIMLSGYAEDETILKAVGVTHQFLAKPCDSQQIVEAINSSINLRAHLASPDLLRFVTGMKTIPSLPDTYHKFMEEVSKPTASTASISAIIESDLGMSATIMKLTNSAYFSLPTRITSIRKAVQFLGLETIRSLVAVDGLFKLSNVRPEIASQIQQISRESMVIAGLAKKIALSEDLDTGEVEQAFCCGLLCRLGCVLLLMNPSNEVKEYLQRLEVNSTTISATEKMLFGTTHSEVGAYLLGLWGFADSIVEAVLHQHDPSRIGVKCFNATIAVYVAESLLVYLSEAKKGQTSKPEMVMLNEPYIRDLGKLDRIPIWIDLYNTSESL